MKKNKGRETKSFNGGLDLSFVEQFLFHSDLIFRTNVGKCVHRVHPPRERCEGFDRHQQLCGPDEIRRANNGRFFPIAFPKTRETRRTKLIAKTKPTP